MRRVQTGDILALAAAVAGRGDAMAHAMALCSEAHAAHAYMKRHHALHPLWGNGSLMSRVYAAGGGMPQDWSPESLTALQVAAKALADWRAQRLDCRAVHLCARRGAKTKE